MTVKKNARGLRPARTLCPSLGRSAAVDVEIADPAVGANLAIEFDALVVHGAMLIEPTESESKASLDLFVATLRDLAMSAKRGEKERFTAAPHQAPRRRLDETRAARTPVLRWTSPAPQPVPAE